MKQPSFLDVPADPIPEKPPLPNVTKQRIQPFLLSKCNHVGRSNHGSVEQVNRSGLVLLVGDDLSIIDLVRTILESSGYNTAAAADEQYAPGNIAPSLIVADLDSTDLDMLERLRRVVRGDSEEVPTLILTAEYDPRCLPPNLRAQEWLGKPFGIDDLLSAVERLSA